MDYILKRYYKFAKLWSPDSERLIEYILWDYEINLKLEITLKFFPIYKLMECYRPSVISVTVTKGGHPRGGRLYGTSGTMGRGVSRVTWTTQYAHEVGMWEREYAMYLDQ